MPTLRIVFAYMLSNLKYTATWLVAAVQVFELEFFHTSWMNEIRLWTLALLQQHFTLLVCKSRFKRNYIVNSTVDTRLPVRGQVEKLSLPLLCHENGKVYIVSMTRLNTNEEKEKEGRSALSLCSLLLLTITPSSRVTNICSLPVSGYGL